MVLPEIQGHLEGTMIDALAERCEDKYMDISREDIYFMALYLFHEKYSPKEERLNIPFIENLIKMHGKDIRRK